MLGRVDGNTMLVSITITLSLLALVFNDAMDDYRRSIEIINDTGRRFEVFWVSVDTGELLPQLAKPVASGASAGLSSFVLHTFELREVPSTKTGECSGDGNICHSVRFTLNENQNQAVLVGKDWTLEHTDDTTRSLEESVDLMSTCEERAKAAVHDGLPTEEAIKTLDELVACVGQAVAEKLKKSTKEINYQAKLRMSMADKWENYTCTDDSLPTSPAVRSYTWNQGDVDRQVSVLHEKAASKIHYIEDFISEEECQAMAEAAEPKLHQATVASGDGGSKITESRKALQAGIDVPWDKEEEGNPIALLSRRVYDFVNYVTGLDIDEFGQENLMSIQYFGRGEDDEAPDRYMPHCDGDCESGLPHKNGTRVATTVMYCNIPEKGGATNFKNAGVHVKPTKHGAVFFAYMNPENHEMDKAFTIHSGCPVIEGEKKIVTQWIRHGVDSENPWDSFNTLGIKYKDLE